MPGIMGRLTMTEEAFFSSAGSKTGLQEIVSNGNIVSMDITNEWIKEKGTKGIVTEKREYIVDGVRYAVDGKHVVLRPTDHERSIADALSEKYGKAVELVP